MSATVQHGDFTFRRLDPKSSDIYTVERDGFVIGRVARIFEGGTKHHWICRAPYSPYPERGWTVEGTKQRTRLASAEELLLIHRELRGIA